jgi:hypothetical protein
MLVLGRLCLMTGAPSLFAGLSEHLLTGSDSDLVHHIPNAPAAALFFHNK